jgi:MFS family permease
MTQPDRPVAGLRASLPLLVAGFVIMFIVIGGGIDTVSVYLNALSAAEGWPRKTLSVAISVGALCAGLFVPVAGMLIDRWGVRVPIAIGLMLLGAGFGVLVSMTEPWHFVAANVLLGPGFASCAMLPITIAVTVLVPDRTALALGIVGVGSSAGALVLAPTIQAIVDAFGWRTAYLVMGLAIVLVPVPFVMFALPKGRLQGGPRIKLPKLRIMEELKRPGVLLLAGVLIIPGIVGFGINVHLVPFLTDHGHATTFAAAALGATIGVSAFGKIAGGFLGDRFGPVQTLRLSLSMMTVAISLLAFASSPIAVWGFVLIDGVSVGAQVAVVPVIAIAILGHERFATLYGLLQLGATLTIGLAPIIPGFVFDATGSYAGALAFWVTAMVAVVAIAFRMRLPEAGAIVAPSPAPEMESQAGI